MGNLARSVVVLALALAAAITACGEPFLVVGDQPGIMRIVIGVGDSIGSRVDSLALRTKLTAPYGVAFDDDNGVLIVGDRGAVRQVGGINTPVARIFNVTSRGTSVRILDAGGCTPGPCMLHPTAIAIAPNGTLVIADQVGNRVFRLVPFGDLAVIAGDGTPATAPDGAQASTSPISRPAGVAVAEDGTIYVSETGAHRIRRIDTTGQLSTIAGTGVPGHSGDGGPAVNAQLHEPAGLAFSNGELYFADAYTHVVRRIEASGTITTIAGAATARGYAGDGGPASGALLDRPVAVAVTRDGGQLFVTDQNNERVRIIDLATGIIRTFAGTGARQWTGNRFPAGETSLHSPAGINAGASGFLFIVDTGHSVVWRTSVN